MKIHEGIFENKKCDKDGKNRIEITGISKFHDDSANEYDYPT